MQGGEEQGETRLPRPACQAPLSVTSIPASPALLLPPPSLDIWWETKQQCGLGVHSGHLGAATLCLLAP